ncbi:hypothetical protein PM082_019422 [Marasmius tenuissimus]|nr:hypothetical protein PM082_019422 [Marasmius tenuissimus]
MYDALSGLRRFIGRAQLVVTSHGLLATTFLIARIPLNMLKSTVLFTWSCDGGAETPFHHQNWGYVPAVLALACLSLLLFSILG